MNIVKLNSSNISAIRPLFEKTKYMGSFIHSKYFVNNNVDFVDHYHTAFSDTYLSDLSSYHAYGAQDDSGKIHGLIGFYESSDDASWYGTNIRNSGNKEVAKLLLDEVIKHNEQRGRFKFYTLWALKHAKLLRKFAFSDWANERYSYFDEFMVSSKHQCQFNFPWQVLFNRTLIPLDTVVRCTFLKQQYRSSFFDAGGL